MILPELAFKKGKQVAGHNIQSWAKRRRRTEYISHDGLRTYSSGRVSAGQLREGLAKEHVKDLSDHQKAKKKARAIDKDFFLSVLGSSATKREARSYIQRFTPPEESTSVTRPSPEKAGSCGVNLGAFYGPAAVQESPKFIQQPEKLSKVALGPQLHVALVKIRAPQILNDDTLNGIGRTLAQLARLGLISVVVIDCNAAGPPQDGKRDANWRSLEIEQANRLISAIDANGETGARLLDNVIGVSEVPVGPGFRHTSAHVTLRKLLMTPLRRSVIPVIPSVGYTDVSQTVVPVLATEIILALTEELAGLPMDLLPGEDPNVAQERLQALREKVSLDRLIVLDPLGGVPSTDRDNGYHVFLNMEQEFEPAKQDLLSAMHPPKPGNDLQGKAKGESASALAFLDPFSNFIGVESDSPKPLATVTGDKDNTEKPKVDNWYHLQNLQLVRSVLSMLPPSSSALLTTPEEAANSGKDAPFQAARVGTRRQRNPLIHNLLTDKPVFSSSLPVGRFGHQISMTEVISPAESITPTTFAKHGISVTTFPNPKFGRWEPPVSGKPQLMLTDSKIDLPRLVHLIEDSFGRKLDVEEYLKRVNSRLAGVIIAGEYEGGALLMWETPPGVKDDGSPESRARMVPYLDKFAVLKRAQGSGGVADLIFKAMVRDCFPRGCVWRSRRNNPVNKWYFERSRGTWKLPGTEWTMFWTTPDLSLDKQLFLDYEGICRGIEPSWADNKEVVD